MALKDKGGGFPVVLNLPNQGIKETFKDRQAILDFLAEEDKCWNDLANKLQSSHLAGVSVLELSGRRALRVARKTIVDGAEDGQAISALSEYDRQNPLILQGTLGTVAMDFGEETNLETSGVLWAIAVYLGSPSLRQTTNQTCTTRDLFAVSYGQSKLNSTLGNSRADRRRIESLLEATNDRLAQAEDMRSRASDALRKIDDEVNAAITKAGSDRDKQRESTEKIIKRIVDRTDSLVSKLGKQQTLALKNMVETSTAEIEEFKQKVRIDIGLEEPTNFWTAKADGHRWMAASFGIVFILAVVAMVVWIESSAVGFVAEAVDRIVGDRQAVALSLVPVAFITVPALAFAWVLRHLSRIIIQNLSLEADARLRGTITKTFKALAADRAMNDAELAIALQALFRPIDGKDHSEIAPPSVGDILKFGGEGKS